MKRVILALAGLLVVSAAYAGFRYLSLQQLDRRVAKFNDDAQNLIMGLQQYKEFVHAYPAGNNLDIAKALLGQTDKKVLILAVRKNDLNSIGEIVDPWGTPLRFYFAQNGVLIRSAGPNKIWDEGSAFGGDDLYRSN